MADLHLGQSMSVRYDFESGGVAYTTAALPFRPDYAKLVNLTTNAENDLLVAEWYRDMTDAHAFATYRMANAGS